MHLHTSGGPAWLENHDWRSESDDDHVKDEEYHADNNQEDKDLRGCWKNQMRRMTITKYD